MAVGIVVGRKLSFNIGQRNVASDANVRALANVREVQVEIHHDRIEAILFPWRVPQQLLAEIALRRGETVVESPQPGKPESPIKMIRLYGVRLALDVEHFLIGFDGVG